MARPKGAPNKSIATPATLALSLEERIKALANLIVDRIEQTQRSTDLANTEMEEE